MNPLPPQAYTRDTLVQAYAWLQAQNSSIKELATTPDVLVSLFLKAKLQGDGALERPSIQNFKNELRNLAGLMGEFDAEVPETQNLKGPSPSSPSRASAAVSPQTFRFRSQDLKAEKLSERASTLASTPQAGSQPDPGPQASATEPAGPSGLEELDARSKDMIQEVRTHFNLSSDKEAMRLLISAGYSRVQSILK